MDYLENLLAVRSAFTFDEQIRYLGWALLLMWMLSITYMTRDFWFPTAFGLHTIPQEEKTPPRKRKKLTSPRRFSMTKMNFTITQLSDRDLRLLADESQRKCQYYLMKQHHRLSSKE
ncbi:hypothetical protein Y032_0026g1484 [Ancylostoma ceylanicum]|uniref:Uncharacterized protein n=1 Tax=Ancylostoma ceylanicum TaxID=53326 RepID=A0A016UW22_9BILA|nr:hypothetical protein Y032_0026g1484 [Ancylostoma ceylanicum]